MADTIPAPIIVNGYVITPGGAPVINTKVVYSIINRPKEFKDLAIDKTYHSVFTDEQGYFEIPLLPDILVKIVIPVTGRTITGVVPFEGPVRFTELS